TCRDRLVQLSDHDDRPARACPELAADGVIGDVCVAPGRLGTAVRQTETKLTDRVSQRGDDHEDPDDRRPGATLHPGGPPAVGVGFTPVLLLDLTVLARLEGCALA